VEKPIAAPALPVGVCGYTTGKSGRGGCEVAGKGPCFRARIGQRVTVASGDSGVEKGGGGPGIRLEGQ